VDPDRHRPNFFAGPYLDRRAELREAADWLEAARADASTHYVVSRGTTQLLLAQPEPRVAFVPGDHPLIRAADESQLVLLGWFRGVRVVLLDLGPVSTQDTEPDLLPGARFEELRPLANNLPIDEGGLLAYARAMAIWRARHRYCGICATALVPERAGHVMRCLQRNRCQVAECGCHALRCGCIKPARSAVRRGCAKDLLNEQRRIGDRLKHLFQFVCRGNAGCSICSQNCTS